MPSTCIHIGEMLARNARIYPNDIALIERTPAKNERYEITWYEFDKMADRFANTLIEKRVKKGDKVVHLMMNSINWLIAYFGILRTGAWAVPINFRFTAPEIKYCIDIAEPKLVVFSEEFKERVEEIKDNVPVKDYIFTGPDVPEFAQSFHALIDQSSDEHPG